MTERMQSGLEAELERLLVERAIEPLDPAAAAELARLGAALPDVDREAYDRAAAAVWLAAAPALPKMPEHLKGRILDNLARIRDSRADD